MREGKEKNMAQQRPNVLILFTDMQRADTVRALGNPHIRTPSLDRLVNEGTAFTSCYSPSPVCVPARCCMHYGLYPQKTGLFDNGVMPDDNGASYPAILGRHGYRTHAIGKCHFTPDDRALRGFQSRQSQEEVTSDPEADDYVAWLRDHGYDYYEPHGARGQMYYIPQISSLPAAAHPSQWIGTESVRWIRETASGAQPWCLFSSFIHPHPPFALPKPWHKLYRAADMPLPLLPADSAHVHTWVNRLQNRYKYRDRGLDLNLLRLIKAYYYGAISFVDFQVGRILRALEEIEALDNTLILFTSDHGEHLGDFGCFGKRSMHDASARVPMLARMPSRFQAGRTCSTATSLCDLFPTLLGACGLSPEGLSLDGRDLAELAAKPEPTRTVYSQYDEGDKAIYMAANTAWKYVYSAGDHAEWLFDRQSDPSETRNLAQSADANDAKLELKQHLLRRLEATCRIEAFTRRGASLDWRRCPRIDETYLDDPDAALLTQDYPSYPTNLPGYTDTEPEPAPEVCAASRRQ
jgi:choline-sulfatase